MKRSRHQIISEILEICRNGANKTRIVYQANLNFRTVNPYLKVLIENRLLDVDQGIYQTTREGISLQESINQVNEMLYGHDKTERVVFAVPNLTPHADPILTPYLS
jgi:predicted transcriptional regulator